MKKITTIILTVAVALTMCPQVFANSTYSQPCVVDYFNGFQSFTKDVGTVDVVPDGFEPYAKNNPNFTKTLSTVTDNDNANHYLKLGADKNSWPGMRMPFSETIRTGKLRISFDLKFDNIDNLLSFYMNARNNTKNDNPYDYSAGEVSSESPLLQFENGKLMLQRNAEQAIELSAIGNSWHKYDITVDFETKKISLIVDGSAHTKLETSCSYGIKALEFIMKGSDDKQTSAYLDNLFIKHYPNGEVNNTEMYVDYVGSAIPQNDALVNVAFSEATSVINEASGNVIESDFNVYSLSDGSNAKLNSINKVTDNSPNAVILNIGKIDSGVYNVVCDSGESYNGLVSLKQPKPSNSFSVVGTEQNKLGQSILVSDDFESYNGGMPANAVSLSGDKTFTGSIEPVERDGGKAIKINNTNGSRTQLVYEFPYKLTSGKFTYEFDVNHTNGCWYTDVICAEGFEADTISKATYDETVGAVDPVEITEAKKKDDFIKNRDTVAIGTTSEDEKIYFQNTKLNYFSSSNDTELSCEKAKWNHIKVDVDIDAATYTVTVNNGTPKTVVLDPDRFRPTVRYRQKTVNGELKWVKTWEYGIKGVSIGVLKNTTMYDNFKVYTDNSYIDYQGFNTSITKPAAWIRQNSPEDFTKAVVSNTGKTQSETNVDKALEISPTWNDVAIAHEFGKSISGKTGFNIEFDLKFDAANKSNLINFRLLPKDKLYSKFENTTTNEKPVEALGDEKGLVNDSTDRGKRYSANVFFGINTDSTSAATDQISKNYLVYANGKETTTNPTQKFFTEDNKQISIDKSDVWYHISIIGSADAQNNLTLKAIITEDGKNPQVSKEQSIPYPANETFEGFGMEMRYQKNDTFKNNKVYIDNFSAKETNTAANVYVTRTSSVDIATGETVPLSNGFAAKGQKAEIVFSAPIKESELGKIKLYKNDKNNDTVVNTTTLLASDNKTVSITVNDELTIGDKLKLEIPNTIKTQSDSNLCFVEAKAVAFSVKEPVAAKLIVNDFRLYKKYSAGNDSLHGDYPECWVPFAESELKDIKSTDKFKFIAKGVNTSADTTIMLGRAARDYDETRLTDFAVDMVNASYGEFTLELPEFTPDNAAGSLETYLWEVNNLRPLCGKFKLPISITSGDSETE